MNKGNRIIPAILILLLIATAIWFFVPAFQTNENIALIGALTTSENIIKTQDRELNYITNEFMIQVAYTEYLKMRLSSEGIDYINYLDFYNDTLDLDYEDDDNLYEKLLDLDLLLLKAIEKGGQPYEQDSETIGQEIEYEDYYDALGGKIDTGN